MKIKVLSRNDNDYLKQRPTDIPRIFHNSDPTLHPFERPRELKRAVNAAKLERVFAKPFIGDLTGHYDGVFCLTRHHRNLTWLASGACDGEIRMWNSSSRKCLGDWKAHKGFVRGVTFSWSQNRIYSCGSDMMVHLWDLPETVTTGIFNENQENPKPVSTWMSKHTFQSIDHQRNSELFSTVSANVLQIWNPERSQPVQTLNWGDDTFNTVRFNPVETHMLATSAEDRGITLYDIRGNTPIKKVILKMNSNCLAWNPMEPFHFTCGNEDQNAYTFDCRNLDVIKLRHEGHVAAVLALDYSPTGREFVTGGYDKSLRIFPCDQMNSREIYYTKRMQRIFSVMYSGDSQFVFTGSDDTNIRVWKSDASRSLVVKHPRQKEKEDYAKALLERHKDQPSVRNIRSKRFVPKPIKTTSDTKLIMKKSQQRKQLNVERHSKPGTVKKPNARKLPIVTSET